MKRLSILVFIFFSISATAEANLKCRWIQNCEAFDCSSEVPEKYKAYYRLLTDSLILKMERNFTMPRTSVINPNYYGGKNSFEYLDNEWLCSVRN